MNDLGTPKEPLELSPLTFPLHGERLIEASAGTGKTFTIASLFIRLLLGHGDSETRNKEPLSVDKILVVTFTEAATGELRDRIRQRIIDTRLAFIKGHSNDPITKEILKSFEGSEKYCCELLLEAERQMDESAIYTIHGFCQRMLTQNAFESGSSFENNFLVDDSKVNELITSNYWRKEFYKLPKDLAALVLNKWSAPKALLNEIKPFLSGNPVNIFNAGKEDLEGAEGIIAKHAMNIERIQKLKDLCSKEIDNLVAAIMATKINKRSFTKKSVPNWTNQIKEWSSSETTNYAYPACLEKFSRSFLEEKTDGAIAVHPLVDEIQALYDEKPSIFGFITADAIKQCRGLLQAEKDRRQLIAFDDLLTKLAAALKNPETGGILASIIRNLYPVAMIDEFQDTDPLQYDIFRKIYSYKCRDQEENRQNIDLSSADNIELENSKDINKYGIFMIGDPKQAIYAFRGADIFTYITAKRFVNSHYTLGTNWRSSADMVDAVNKIFSKPKAPFIYDKDISFSNTKSAPNADKREWLLDGNKMPALTISHFDTLANVPKDEYYQSSAFSAAAEIKRILSSKNAYLSDKGDQRQIKASDIAVLVRTGDEAAVIKSALSSFGVQSVYLSGRGSVYSTVEAKDILHILNAVTACDDDYKIKTALATSILNLSASELMMLEQDELKWEQIGNEFAQYKKVLEFRGVQAMLSNLMFNRKIPETLLAAKNGERKLTDLLHIAEQLQIQQQKLGSSHAVIRWLKESIENPNSQDEEQQLRLESDDSLVQIVTIHKSKGLEYNLVYLPFICSFRKAKTSLFHDEDGRTFLDPESSFATQALADKERLAEDVRLLYVALTRAVYGCHMTIAPLQEGNKTKAPSALDQSAIGKLIYNGENPVDIEVYNEIISRLTTSFPSFSIKRINKPEEMGDLPELVDAPLTVQEMDSTPCKARVCDLRNINSENWYVTSYSNLVQQGHSHSHYEPEVTFTQEDTIEDEDEPKKTIFNFYKGAKPGTFLHTIFEEIDFCKEATSTENAEIIKNLMAIEGYEEEWLPVLQEMVENVLTRPLDADGVTLRDVPEHHRKPEMEFMLPIQKLEARKLSKLIAKHDPMSRNLTELEFRDVSGMLKGFIDLTFCANGKFYVLDWKSNHIGDTAECYTQEAIKESMRDHRYDLQYQLYSLALHRYLKFKLKDYNYDEHFGGVYYVYLRGMETEGTNGLFAARPSEEFLNDLELFIDGKY